MLDRSSVDKARIKLDIVRPGLPMTSIRTPRPPTVPSRHLANALSLDRSQAMTRTHGPVPTASYLRSQAAPWPTPPQRMPRHVITRSASRVDQIHAPSAKSQSNSCSERQKSIKVRFWSLLATESQNMSTIFDLNSGAGAENV